MADSLQIIISLILLRNDNISLAKYLTVSVLQMQCTRKVNLCGKCPQPKLLTAFKGKLLWKLLEGCLLLLHLFQVRRQHRYQCLSKWGEILAQIDPFPPLLQYIWIRYLIVYITKKNLCNTYMQAWFQICMGTIIWGYSELRGHGSSWN